MRKEFELSPWTIEGFEAPPEIREVKGGERIYRVFGGTSNRLANCFFVPAVGSVPINYWTADLLEMELNASLWGNDFEAIQEFTMNRVQGAKYKIGHIAQSGYAGIDNDQLFYQRSFVTPSKIFKQVAFVLDHGVSLSMLITHVGKPHAVSAGRYHRIQNRTWQ